MSDEAKPVKPGYQTTEFWLVLAANLVGALLVSGIFPGDSTAMKMLGMAAMVLTTLGYNVQRSSVKKATTNAAKLLLFMMLPLAMIGCCKGHVSASAIDPLTQDVTTRHDLLLTGKLQWIDLNSDGKVDDRDDQLRATYLRSSLLLRRAMAEALGKKPPE